MTYEMIDVVNEQDQVIGSVARTPEWDQTRPTIHRYVQVFVIHPESNKILVQQRHPNKSTSPLAFDAAVGGLVQSGYSYFLTAHKEMEEELGIHSPLRLIKTFKDKEAGGRTRAHCNLFYTKHPGPFYNWHKEAIRLEWFSFKELDYLVSKMPYLFTRAFLQSYPIISKELSCTQEAAFAN